MRLDCCICNCRDTQKQAKSKGLKRNFLTKLDCYTIYSRRDTLSNKLSFWKFSTRAHLLSFIKDRHQSWKKRNQCLNLKISLVKTASMREKNKKMANQKKLIYKIHNILLSQWKNIFLNRPLFLFVELNPVPDSRQNSLNTS